MISIPILTYCSAGDPTPKQEKETVRGNFVIPYAREINIQVAS